MLPAKVSHNKPRHNRGDGACCVTYPHLGPMSHTHRRQNLFSRGWLWDTLADVQDKVLGTGADADAGAPDSYAG